MKETLFVLSMIEINCLKTSSSLIKINNKRLNRLVKVRLKFNKMIKNVNSAVFAAAKEISIDEKWNRIEKENFETFDYFYNSNNA